MLAIFDAKNVDDVEEFDDFTRFSFWIWKPKPKARWTNDQDHTLQHDLEKYIVKYSVNDEINDCKLKRTKRLPVWGHWMTCLKVQMLAFIWLKNWICRILEIFDIQILWEPASMDYDDDEEFEPIWRDLEGRGILQINQDHVAVQGEQKKRLLVWGHWMTRLLQQR